MTLTKIFVSNHHDTLSESINDFINLYSINILDIKYSMAMDTENDEMYYSAFIMYEQTVGKPKSI